MNRFNECRRTPHLPLLFENSFKATRLLKNVSNYSLSDLRYVFVLFRKVRSIFSSFTCSESVCNVLETHLDIVSEALFSI